MSLSELVTFIGAAGVCGIVFVAIGIWAFCRKAPMHFWAGSTVPAESITDVKKYNKANGIIWTVAAIPYFISGIIAFFDFNIASIILTISCFGGLLFLFIAYTFIYKHFSVKS